MKFTIELAGRLIGIRSLYPEIHDMCREYLSDRKPEFEIAIVPEDIACERALSDREVRFEGKAPEPFPDSYLETLAVYRKIADRLLAYDTLLFHGSAIAVDGSGYLFTGKSGAGKSTHARLWRELLGERAVMVNDDKPLLKITKDSVIVYGTPWDGKHHLSRNISVPLKAIGCLEQSGENRITELEKSERLPILLQQVYRPRDPGLLLKTLPLVNRLAATVRLYELSCNMEPEAARVAYHGMNR